MEEPAHDLSDGEMSESCVPHHHHRENDTVHVNMVQATRQNIILLESVHYPGDAPRIKSGKQDQGRGTRLRCGGKRRVFQFDARRRNPVVVV